MADTMGIKNVLRGWRAELEAAGRAPGTISVRMSHARRCLTEVGRPVNEIDRDDIVRWLAGRDWGPSARASARTSLRLLWRWMASTGRVSENVCDDLPTILQPRATPRPVPDVIVMESIKQAPPRVALAIEIMATCGLRRAECARIRAGDVEPAGQGWALRVLGKGGHVRVVPCPPHLARRIRDGGGWLFPGHQDGHISPGWLGKLIARVLPDGWTPHKLRHRYATVAYGHGHDLRAVQQLLGHASVATTQVYVAVRGEQVAESAGAAWRIAA